MSQAGSRGRTVVSRHGYSRTLTIPTEIVEQKHIEVGETYCVEPTAEGIFYRRAGELGRGRRFMGQGRDRFVELPRGAVLPGGNDPAPLPPIDWDS